MYDLMFGIASGHTYSFAATGLGVGDMVFSSRQEANRHMYDLCDKFGLRVSKVYDDKHDKTYVCDNGVCFYIQRM